MRQMLPLVLIVLFAAPLLSVPQTALAASPAALKTFSGTLAPGDSTSLTWQLNSDVPEPGFLFHYVITGGSDLNDVAYVSIDSGDRWDYLMGEGWTYCSLVAAAPCPLDAGSYTVTVEAEGLATGPITFDIGFYLPPQPPADFNGHIPSNSDVRISNFGVVFPNAVSVQLVLGVTSGSYEFFIDGESRALVTSTTELNVDLAAGFHQFEVNTEVEGVGEDIAWSVRVPSAQLDVRILSPCPTLNPESGQSECVIGANATASDGSSPAVSYLWTASGGSFNSTSGQWVKWTAPSGVANFTLTVEASAPGYVSGTYSMEVQVVPEFPSSGVPFLVAVALAVVLFTRRSRQRPAARTRTPVADS